MGETDEDVLTLTDISEDDRKKFDSVITKFDSFFKVRKNVIIECACFNYCSQEDSELAEEFITSLYQHVENCEYGALQDQMIRDCIVVRTRHQALYVSEDADRPQSYPREGKDLQPPKGGSQGTPGDT